MLDPRVINGVVPLQFSADGSLICAINQKFGAYDIETKKFLKIANWTNDSLSKLMSKIDLLSRILRVGVHALYEYKNGYLGISKEGVFYNEGEDSRFIFKEYKGSRPLNICINPLDKIAYFGEYFSNPERGEVSIFKTNDGINWEKAWTFKSDQIRHVHGCIYDSFKKGVWVLTGDSDKESVLWFTDDSFNTLSYVYGGSQKYRAVEIIPTKNGLIAPMDSPIEKNYIQSINHEDDSVTRLCELPGSAFHAKKVASYFFVSTVTEPSEVNKVEYASLYGSLDGVKWKLISKLKKDIFPVAAQKYTRYSEISFLEDNNKSKYLIAQGRALKKVSNGMLIWDLDEIGDFLINEN